MATLKEKIEKINQILDGFGDEAIQEEKRPFGSLWGYKPQYLIDAVNEVLGIDGWGYKLIEMKTTPADGGKITAIAQVEVYIKVGDSLICKGPQFGVSTNFPGDAEKGALTDAIGKSFSLWGIGNKAYRGLLRPSGNGNANSQKEENPAPDEKPASQEKEANPETPQPTQSQSPEPPTKQQMALIKKLCAERGVPEVEVHTKEEASEKIKELLKIKKIKTE
jgi:hypothetical protein